MTYLDAEIGFFEEKRAEWLVNHRGQWAVVHARSVEFYPTEIAAYAAGRQMYLEEPFLLRRVVEEHEDEAVTRLEFLDDVN
jgi:hypothetical protein